MAEAPRRIEMSTCGACGHAVHLGEDARTGPLACLLCACPDWNADICPSFLPSFRPPCRGRKVGGHTPGCRGR